MTRDIATVREALEDGVMTGTSRHRILLAPDALAALSRVEAELQRLRGLVAEVLRPEPHDRGLIPMRILILAERLHAPITAEPAPEAKSRKPLDVVGRLGQGEN